MYDDLYANAQLQLKTGKKINSAADDVAAISHLSKVKSSIAEADIFAKSISEGITILNTADSALSSIRDLLVGIRADFAAGTATGVSDDDRDAYQTAINDKLAQIDDIVDNTTYEGNKLLDGSQDYTVQVSSNYSQTLRFQSETGVAGRGIEIDLTNTGSGAGGRGHLSEGAFSGGWAPHYLSTDAPNVNTYQGWAGTIETPNGLDSIDDMIANIDRMRIETDSSGLEDSLAYYTNKAAVLENHRSNREDIDVNEVNEAISNYETLSEGVSSIFNDSLSSSRSLILTLLGADS